MEETGQHKLLKWRESAKATLCRFQAHSEPVAISSLPEELREQNKNTYTPKAINIGPRFTGTRRNLLKLEETKWHYMQSLLHRGPKGPERNLEECTQVVIELESEVCASYGEGDLKLEWNDLANIMLSDACFLLELLISESDYLNVRVPLFPRPQIKKEMLTDMLVLENQIPLVILHKLSEKLFNEAYLVPIESLALNLFGYFPNRSFKYFTPNIASHNFLELVHSYISDDSYDQERVLEQEAHEGNHQISITINTSTKLLQVANQYANCGSSSGINNGCVKCVSSAFKGCGNCCASPLKLKQCFGCGSAFKGNGCGACSGASEFVHVCGCTCNDCSFPDATNNVDFDNNMNRIKAKNIQPLNFHAEFNRCAPILEAAGVKIQMSSPEKKLGDPCQPVIPGVKFDIKFSKGTLEIPQLHITSSTQVMWQNLIAWEQCHTGLSCKHKCTWAAFFFNGLICCGNDVQLLKDRKVIVDHLNMSNQKLMEFFRSLISGVDRDKTNDSPYWEMISELNSYYGKCCLKIKRYSIMLRHSWIPMIARQFDRVVLRGYNLLVGMISVYALMQTIYTMLGYYHSK
ncbi:hypothetical protein HN51_066509 [Arachis hypogaea]|uniref:uncharacterized protein LOC110271019 n=1 Tax=Arachis ipaensis TaxID=130454 RepID=UPI000A2B4D00|nr:uncharacterized protein LOC110271019 [Arachis ipaensis]QHO07194.1 UPF0481 protein [Arachis hypogaea]